MTDFKDTAMGYPTSLVPTGTWPLDSRSYFEDKLSAFAGLTACIPMLMDTGGNSGNQVSTLIIRGLALGNIKISDYFKVLWKEIRVALLCGITTGTTMCTRITETPLKEYISSNGDGAYT